MSLVESPLGLFIEDAPAALAIFDRKMRYVHASSGWRRDFGLGDRDLRGLSHYEIFPEIPDRWKEVHRRGLLGEVLYEDRDKFQRADGRVQWLRWKVRPWYESKGSIAGIVIFTEDISARVRAEEALRLSEERYRYLVEATSDIVWNGEKTRRWHGCTAMAGVDRPNNRAGGGSLDGVYSPRRSRCNRVVMA